MKKLLIGIIGALILAVSFPAFAIMQSQSSVYQFHLYYDNGQIVPDRDAQFKYDILSEDFIPETISIQFPYSGEIINFAGEIANHFTFDPKHGDVKFVKGKITVKTPYVADAQKAVFFDPQNNPVLTIDISDSSFCNDDGVCNADRGEDSLTCAKDCKQSLPAQPIVSPTPDNEGSGSIVSGIVYTVVGLVLLGLLWWFFKRRSRLASSSSFAGSPSVPPQTSQQDPSLPTPPTPPGSQNTL